MALIFHCIHVVDHMDWSQMLHIWNKLHSSRTTTSCFLIFSLLLFCWAGLYQLYEKLWSLVLVFYATLIGHWCQVNADFVRGVGKRSFLFVSWKIVYELIVNSLNFRINQQNAWSWNFSFKRFTCLSILVPVRLIILSVLNFDSLLRH